MCDHCASTDGARRAQNCALYTSVCFVVSVPLFAMCSRLFMSVCRSQMFVNMRCKIHSLYTSSRIVSTALCLVAFQKVGRLRRHHILLLYLLETFFFFVTSFTVTFILNFSCSPAGLHLARARVFFVLSTCPSLLHDCTHCVMVPCDAHVNILGSRKVRLRYPSIFSHALWERAFSFWS